VDQAHTMTGKRILEAIGGRSKKPNMAQKQLNWKMLSLPIKRPKARPHWRQISAKWDWQHCWSSLDAWTTSFISEVYRIPNEEEIDYIKEDKDWALFFKINSCDTEVGWKVEHCLDKELHELMAFLLPIFISIKSHQIIKSFASTLLAAWKEGR
jgi:hypothetical protein